MGSVRERDREYYLSREHALQYDRRSQLEKSAARYRKAAETFRKYLTHGEVLDIGCGPARMIIAMARILPGLSFTGIDVSGEMVEIAARNLKTEGLAKRVRLMPIPAEGLGALPEVSYDMVMSHGSFSGWLEPAASLLQIRRILKDGGFLYVADWDRSAPEELRKYMEEAGDDPEQRERIMTAFESSYTEEELLELLSASGLSLMEFAREGIWISAVLRKGSRPLRAGAGV